MLDIHVDPIRVSIGASFCRTLVFCIVNRERGVRKNKLLWLLPSIRSDMANSESSRAVEKEDIRLACSFLW